MATISSPPDRHTRRRLLGLRRRPGRAALALMRMPLRAYRHGAGWMLGRTFIAFAHVGRKSGRRYEAVAMVLGYEESTGEAVVCAVWGPETDWYRNLRAGPCPRAWLGRDTFEPELRFLTDAEAVDAATRFRREHPHRLRLMSRIMGWGDLRDDAKVREFVQGRPFLGFRPSARVRADLEG
jgi:deazaflavin-dependent oxidoreductase (nitroreductase family)